MSSSHDRRAREGGVPTCALPCFPPMETGWFGERPKWSSRPPIASDAIVANGTLVSTRERPPLAELVLTSTVYRVAFSGGRGCFQRAGIRGYTNSTVRSFPSAEARTKPKRKREGTGKQDDEERRREDGTRREGRFVNAEIGRAAPRREPSADSQSRCERSKERNGCFTLYVWTRFQDVHANRVVSQRYRVLVLLRGSLKMHENTFGVGRRTTSTWVKRSKTVTRVNSRLSLKTRETEPSHAEFAECSHGRDYKAWKEGERVRRLRNWHNWRLNAVSQPSDENLGNRNDRRMKEEKKQWTEVKLHRQCTLQWFPSVWFKIINLFFEERFKTYLFVRKRREVGVEAWTGIWTDRHRNCNRLVHHDDERFPGWRVLAPTPPGQSGHQAITQRWWCHGHWYRCAAGTRWSSVSATPSLSPPRLSPSSSPSGIAHGTAHGTPHEPSSWIRGSWFSPSSRARIQRDRESDYAGKWSRIVHTVTSRRDSRNDAAVSSSSEPTSPGSESLSRTLSPRFETTASSSVFKCSSSDASVDPSSTTSSRQPSEPSSSRCLFKVYEKQRKRRWRNQWGCRRPTARNVLYVGRSGCARTRKEVVR